MAGPGTYTAYQQLRPLEGDLAGDVIKQDELAFKRREEGRIEDEIKQRQEARAQAVKDKQTQRYENVKGAVPTGIKNIDSLYVNWMNQVKDKRTELYEKQLRGEELTPDETVLYTKLDNAPETMALMTKSFQEADKAYNQALAKGEIKRDLKYEADRERLMSGAMPFIDDDGNPVLGMDNDADGKPEIVGFDLTNGLSMKPNFIENIDYNAILGDVAKTIDPSVNTTDRNYRTVKTTGLSADDAKERSKTIVYNANGYPSKTAISYFYDAGYAPEEITPQMLDKFQNKVANDLMLSVKRGREENYDYGAATGDRREARLSVQEREKSSGSGKGNNTASLDDLNPIGSTVETTVGKESKKPTGPGEKTGTVYQGNVAIKRKAGGAEETFRSFGVDKDGNVTVTVDFPVKTEKGQPSEVGKKKYNSKENADIVAYFAQRFKDPETGEFIDTIDELRDKLESKGKANTGKQETAAERALRIANGG